MSCGRCADSCAMTDNGDFLSQVLLQRVQQTHKSQPRETVLDCAIAAAVAPDVDSRAWSLVTLAARLRAEGEYQRGLQVLDAAVAFNPSWEAQSAAFTTAAAIHCDLDDLDTARAICDETLAKGVDKFILSVALRVYWELFRSTKLREFHDRWLALSAALEDMTNQAASASSSTSRVRAR